MICSLDVVYGCGTILHPTNPKSPQKRRMKDRDSGIIVL